jgi:hypothetical protein
LVFLLLCRVVLPSYTFLNSYSPRRLFAYVRRCWRPDLFTRIEQQAVAFGAVKQRRDEAVLIICKLVVHTGRDADQLTGDDVLAFRGWVQHLGRRHVGGAKQPNLAWDLLRGVTDLGGQATLRDALRLGQRSTAELVDAYRIRCTPIRNVFIRYLNERRPALDHRSFRRLITDLVGNFWADLEHHHPSIDSLHLPDGVAEAWKQRMRLVTTKDGTSRPRGGYLDLLVRVRSFYLDVPQWALQDPSWAGWAVPSPVRKGETDGYGKVQQQVTATMHQRVRDRLPHLPVLLDTAKRHRAEQAALLATARAVEPGHTFTHDGRSLRRLAGYAVRRQRQARRQAPDGAGRGPGHRCPGRRRAQRGRGVLGLGDHRDAAAHRSAGGGAGRADPPGLGLLPLPDTGEVVPVLQTARAWRTVALREFDRHVMAFPDALRAPDPHCPWVLVRLAHALTDAGYPVQLPACVRCRKTPVRLVRATAEGRCCDWCVTRNRTRVCARCGQEGHPVADRGEGMICRRCYRIDPQFLQLCTGCGNLRPPTTRNADGKALCWSCAPRPDRTCCCCSQPGRIHARTAAGPVCRNCYREPDRPCGRCGRHAPIAVRARKGQPDLCHRCRPDLRHDCSRCGRTRPAKAIWPTGPVCQRCHRRVLTTPATCAGCQRTRVLIGTAIDGAGLCGPCAGAASTTCAAGVAGPAGPTTPAAACPAHSPPA